MPKTSAPAPFVSRADNSGTHKREMEIWRQAGVTPQGAWYLRTGDFMGASLRQAHAKDAYFMTDSSTWYAHQEDLPKLDVLFRGDPVLVNVYHALCQPDGATPGAGLAARFVRFLAAPQAQQVFRSYGTAEYGQKLYHDAEYAKRYE